MSDLSGRPPGLPFVFMQSNRLFHSNVIARSMVTFGDRRLPPTFFLLTRIRFIYFPAGGVIRMVHTTFHTRRVAALQVRRVV